MVYAAIRPSFGLNYSTQSATHILVVTEGDTIDGVFTVLESWKGNIKPGETIMVPELAAFNSESSREINYSWNFVKKDKDPNQITYVTGKRMILFLKKSSTLVKISSDSEKNARYKENITWLTTSWGHDDMKTSVIWIEKDKAYIFYQVKNPGPSILVSYNHSEEQIKKQILQIIDNQIK
jgi:hypothetical protein